jgi:hypothetical protein
LSPHVLLFANSELSAVVFCLQTAIIQLDLKRRHRITDTAFDSLCKFNHKIHSQGPNNYYPRSLWLMKRVAGVADARTVQVSKSRRVLCSLCQLCSTSVALL